MSNRNPLEAELNIQAFIDNTMAEYEQVQRELREIDILVKQSAAEVERHAQRNAQVSSYVRQLEPQFETTPRADIINPCDCASCLPGDPDTKPQHNTAMHCLADAATGRRTAPPVSLLARASRQNSRYGKGFT